jgi:hypothetical protein
MNGNTPATDAYPRLENDGDGHVNGAAKKRKEIPAATPSHSSQYDVDHVRYWKTLTGEFEALEEKNCHANILQFLETRMPQLGDRSDLEAAAIPPVPAAVQEEPIPTLLWVRSDSSTFTEALLAAAPAALEASLIEINSILGNEESLKVMANDRCSKNTELKRLESLLPAADAFRLLFGFEYDGLKKSLETRKGKIEGKIEAKAKIEAIEAIEAKIEAIEAKAKIEAKIVKYTADKKTYIWGALTKAIEVSYHLNFLSGLSQLTEVTYAQTTIDANVEKTQEKNRSEFVRKHQRPEDSGIQQAKPQMIRDGVVDNAEPFDDYSEESFNKQSEKALVGENKLVFISKVYEALFSTACFIPRKFDTPENKVFYNEMLQKAISYLELVEKEIRDGTMYDGTCSEICDEIRKENVHEGLVKELMALNQWLHSKKPQEIKKPQISVHEQLDDDTVAALDELKGDQVLHKRREVLCKGLLDKLMPQLLWLPGPTCQEVHGVQVVFQRLLGAIAACLPASTTVSEKSSKRTTPEKHGKAERSIAPTEHRPKRRSDFTIWIREKHIAIMYDDAMEVTIEIKPGQRMMSSMAKLYQECLNQGLSHAAKSLLPALNLGSGLPAHCTFVVASPVYVQVLMLSTVDTGTPHARVLLKQSVRFPLVSIESCDRFYASDQRHDEKVNAEFLGNRKNVDSIFAIKALAKIMTSPRDDLVGLSRRDSRLRVLGSGTYGQVLGTGKNDSVLKVSRYGRMAHLLDEVAVLQMLMKDYRVDEVGRSNVIYLKGFGMVPADLCGVKLPGAILSPRGVSAIGYDFHGLLGKVANGLWNGLAFLHSRGIAHNDFSYRNFVIVDGRAVIIDLACARPINTVMNEFVGTPDFAHIDVHKNSCLWLARAAHDIAALAYTLCVVQNRGKIPWKPIGQPCKDETILKQRDVKTLSMFEGEGELKNQLEDVLLKKLLAALRENPIRFCMCKSKNCGKACGCTVCTDGCKCKDGCKKRLKPALEIAYVSRDAFVEKELRLPDDNTNGDFAGP